MRWQSDKVVEMLAPPGAGKSTFAGFLRREFEQRATKCEDLFEFVGGQVIKHEIPFFPPTAISKLPWLLQKFLEKQYAAQRNYYLSRYARVFESELPEIGAFIQRQIRTENSSASDLDRWAYKKFRLFAGAYQAHLEDGLPVDRWFVIDEGFVQRGLSFYSLKSGRETERELLDYLNAIPIPYVLVAMSDKAEKLLLHMQGRERGITRRVSELEEGARLKFLNRFMENQQLTKKILKARGSQVFEVEDQDSLESLREQAFLLLLRLGL